MDIYECEIEQKIYTDGYAGQEWHDGCCYSRICNAAKGDFSRLLAEVGKISSPLACCISCAFCVRSLHGEAQAIAESERSYEDI